MKTKVLFLALGLLASSFSFAGEYFCGSKNDNDESYLMVRPNKTGSIQLSGQRIELKFAKAILASESCSVGFVPVSYASAVSWAGTSWADPFSVTLCQGPNGDTIAEVETNSGALWSWNCRSLP